MPVGIGSPRSFRRLGVDIFVLDFFPWDRPVPTAAGCFPAAPCEIARFGGEGPEVFQRRRVSPKRRMQASEDRERVTNVCCLCEPDATPSNAKTETLALIDRACIRRASNGAEQLINR